VVQSELQVVVVERDANQRLLYEWELADEGHSVQGCDGPGCASRLADRAAADVVVVDASYTTRDVTRLRKQYPRAAFLVHSACEARLKEGTGGDAQMLKSSDMSALKRAIRKLAITAAG